MRVKVRLRNLEMVTMSVSMSTSRVPRLSQHLQLLGKRFGSGAGGTTRILALLLKLPPLLRRLQCTQEASRDVP